MVFTSIGHSLNEELLRECHEKMDGKKAVGIDGISKEEYGAHLEENLELLEGRIESGSLYWYEFAETGKSLRWRLALKGKMWL